MRRVLFPLLIVVIGAAVVLVSSGAGAPAKCTRLSCLQSTPTRVAVPLASINLRKEKITPSGTTARVSGIDFGSEIAFTVSDGSVPLVYRLSIPLSSDERLTVLPEGGAAITQTLSLPEGSDSPDDYGDAPDQVHDNTTIEILPEDTVPDGIEEDQDPSWYPGGDEVESDTRDGVDISGDAFDQVEHQIPDGDWVMVSAFDPPLATDANGREIPIFLTKCKGGLTLSIAPPGSAVFPIKVVLRYGYDPDSYDAEG